MQLKLTVKVRLVNKLGLHSTKPFYHIGGNSGGTVTINSLYY